MKTHMSQSLQAGFSGIRVILGIAVAGAVIAGLYFFIVDSYTSRVSQLMLNNALSGAATPDELADASYLLTSPNGGGLIREGKLAYDDYAHDGSLVLDIARAGGVEARLVYVPQSESYEIRVGEKSYITSNLLKKNLFLSQDGTRAAVSVSATTYGTPNPADWKVVVIDFASGEMWDVAGFAAAFKDGTDLYVFRDDGVYAVAYEEGTGSKLLEMPTPYVYRSIAQDESGTKLAWATLGDEAFVYERNDNPETPLLPVFSKRGIFGSIALTSENLYDLAPKKGGGTALIRYGLFSDQVETVRSLPTILAISKLLP